MTEKKDVQCMTGPCAKPPRAMKGGFGRKEFSVVLAPMDHSIGRGWTRLVDADLPVTGADRRTKLVNGVRHDS